MKCITCGRDISSGSTHCQSCVSRVRAYGEEGTKWIYELVSSNRGTSREELLEFIKKYYIGKMNNNNDIFQSLYKSIIKAGYSVKIDNYPYKYKMDAHRIRIRQLRKSSRSGLKKDKCELCEEKNEKLHLHHIVPIAFGGKSIKKNLITLCGKCHKKAHNKLNLLLLRYLEPQFENIYEYVKPSIEK